eukprot:scaffold9110_cov52-Phaeocystis_antarctica.AAC.3
MLAHAEVARLLVGHKQRQPLRLCLLPRLLARQRRAKRPRRCSPLRRRLPLRRSREAKCRLLCGGEGAKAHLLATALHLCLVGLGPAGMAVHTEVARLAVGHEQRQPLRLRLLPRRLAQHDCRKQRSPTQRAVVSVAVVQ